MVDLNVLTDYFKRATEILPTGAFLTTIEENKVNTMTIGWGAFGFEWGMPIAQIMVRESRLTKVALEKNMDFTMTFPCDDSMKNALAFCGSRSGRDVDKIAECNIDLVDSKEIKTPAVACKGIVFECRVIARCEMNECLTNEEIISKWYKNGDLHTMYYAKIENCYEIK